MLCSYHYGPTLLRFWFQTNLGRKNWASYLDMQAGKTFSYQEKTLRKNFKRFSCLKSSVKKSKNRDADLKHKLKL